MPREVPLIGLVMAVVGLLLFLRLTPDGTYLVDLLPGIMLTSIGMGLTFVPVTLIATSGIPTGDAGLASGLFNTSQQIGGALGLAILSTIATSATSDTLESLGRRADRRRHGERPRRRLPRRLDRERGVPRRRRGAAPALLRRRDVVAASHGEAAPAAV